MRTSNIVIAVTLSVGFISGCASNGSGPQNVADGVSSAFSGIGKIAGGFLQPYTNGVEVTEKQLEKLEVGMEASEVEQIIGFPPEVQSLGEQEMWSYPFSEITHFSGNTNETTIVRFDSDGKMTRAYKTSSRGSSSGNALLDAANNTN